MSISGQKEKSHIDLEDIDISKREIKLDSAHSN